MKQQKHFAFRKPSDWNNGIAVHLDPYVHGLQIRKDHHYRNVQKLTLPASYEDTTWKDAIVAKNGRWYWLDDQERVWRMERNFAAIELVFVLPAQEGLIAHRISIQDNLLVVLYQSNDEDSGKHSQLFCYFLDSGQLKWKLEAFKDQPFVASAVLLLDDQSTVVTGTLPGAQHVQLLQFDNIGLAMNAVDVYRCSAALVHEADFIEEWSARNRLLQHKNGDVVYADAIENQIVCWDVKKTIRYLTLDRDISNMVSMAIDENNQYWMLLLEQQAEEGRLISFDENGRYVEHGTTPLTKGQYVVARGDQLQVINVTDGFAYTLIPQLLPSFWDKKQSYSGVWLSMPLNSGELGTQWHKIILDASIHNDTAINIHVFATDHLEVNVAGEKIHLVEWLQHNEAPIEQKLDILQPLWQQTIVDPQDALLNNLIGQYLMVAVELMGTDSHSPGLHALDVYFPRQSYVSDLPVIYQRTDSGFLTNYLSIFQTLIEKTDQRILSAPRTLEASMNSGSSLKWLLSWLGIDSEDYWSEEQLRELLIHAPKLSNMRGTRYAIETLVKIYTGYRPIILEYDDIKPLKENIELRDVVDRLYVTDPHTFNVLVKADVVDTELKRITLEHILDKYKPVFSACKLVVLQPWVYMDLHSYLGMNTILTAPQQLLLDGISSMPHHTITMELGQENQLNKHSRLGLNSRLE